MKYDISLTLAGVLICIAICLFAILIWGTEQANNKREKVISVTGEWSNSDDCSLGEYLAERWTEKRSGSTPDKIQE